MSERRDFLWAIALVLVLQVTDWALTWDAIAYGAARELNPVGRAMLATGPLPSLGLKLGLVALGCAGLYALRSRRVARVGITLVLVTYALLLGWHVAGRLWAF